MGSPYEKRKITYPTLGERLRGTRPFIEPVTTNPSQNAVFQEQRLAQLKARLILLSECEDRIERGEALVFVPESVQDSEKEPAPTSQQIIKGLKKAIFGLYVGFEKDSSCKNEADKLLKEHRKNARREPPKKSA